MKRKFINKAMSIALSTAMLVGVVPAYPVLASNTGATSLDINVLATNIDISVPTNVVCTIDPNQVVPEDRFQYGELNITNNGTAPVDVSVTSFTDADSTFEENITPEGLPDGLEWNNLSVADSAKYFALGIKANDESSWENVNLSDYVYVPEVVSPNLVGTLISGESCKMDLDAAFGLAFKNVQNFSYELVFNAELSQTGATGSGSSTENTETYTIDKEESSQLNYQTTPDGTASIDLNSLLGVDTVYAAPTEVNKDDFDTSKVKGTAVITGIKDNSLSEVYIADYLQDANGDYYEITGINSTSFENAEDLQTIETTNPNINVVDGVIYNEDMTELILSPSSNINTTIVIPDSVTKIHEKAFYRSNVQDLTVGKGVVEVGNEAFADMSVCSKLTWNPTNCTSYPSSDVFHYLDGSQGQTGCTVIIGDNVQSIPRGFLAQDIDASGERENIKVKSITIGSGVTSIGENAFSNAAYYLEELNYNAANATIGQYSIWGQYSQSSVYATAIAVNGGLDITFGETVQVVPWRLWKCDITTIDLGESVSSVTYKEGALTTIGGGAPANTSITELVIPEGVQSVSSMSCYKGLTTITLPSTLTEIGDYAFQNCSSLATINYNGSESDWGNINIGTENTPITNATKNYN